MPTPMTLRQVLLEQATTTYDTAGRLFARVSAADLPWKPATGENWMSVGQLLMHCAAFGCGRAVAGFVTGDWRPDGEVGSAEVDADVHQPPATSLPSVRSVAQAQALLAEDRRLTLLCLEEVDESALLGSSPPAPWGGPALSLFQQLSLMIWHLHQHKGQLFYYLKLMGRDVSTTDLWGA